jgi:hypothetical protein
MIYRFEVVIRRVRRWLSRTEWAVRLLGLPRSPAVGHARGLVIVQIDGLSRSQLERALAAGKMPFLRRLIGRERYRLHTLYSGLPSSTPAVQGELFYGVKGAVPAFSFRDRESGRIVRMIEGEAAMAAERRIEGLGDPLLKGGAAYFDIFTGGAEESHFCPSSLGWGPFLRAANPLAMAFLFASNAYSVVRLAVLLVIEVVLAVHDCILGLIAGRDLPSELKFVPTRAAISILLRDLVRIGAEIDTARGLPVIHLNFVGYDEQAHRRGPSSAFAHWSLKGIDDSIARIWKAARRSVGRDYDLWVYSDHGQEKTVSYARRFGRSVEEAVADVFDRADGPPPAATLTRPRGVQSQRVRFLGGRKSRALFPVYREPSGPTAAKPMVAAMGPIGFVYARLGASGEGRHRRPAGRRGAYTAGDGVRGCGPRARLDGGRRVHAAGRRCRAPRHRSSVPGRGNPGSDRSVRPSRRRQSRDQRLAPRRNALQFPDRERGARRPRSRGDPRLRFATR